MLAVPPNIAKTIAMSGDANARADAHIVSLAAEVAKKCMELDAHEESNDLPDNAHRATDEPDLMDAWTAGMAADLDRLEGEIAESCATTIEGLRAKAEAANKLRRFGYDSIPDSIIRDLITNDSPLTRAGNRFDTVAEKIKAISGLVTRGRGQNHARDFRHE